MPLYISLFISISLCLSRHALYFYLSSLCISFLCLSLFLCIFHLYVYLFAPLSVLSLFLSMSQSRSLHVCLSVFGFLHLSLCVMYHSMSCISRPCFNFCLIRSLDTLEKFKVRVLLVRLISLFGKLAFCLSISVRRSLYSVFLPAIETIQRDREQRAAFLIYAI